MIKFKVDGGSKENEDDEIAYFKHAFVPRKSVLFDQKVPGRLPHFFRENSMALENKKWGVEPEPIRTQKNKYFYEVLFINFYEITFWKGFKITKFIMKFYYKK